MHDALHYSSTITRSRHPDTCYLPIGVQVFVCFVCLLVYQPVVSRLPPGSAQRASKHASVNIDVCLKGKMNNNGDKKLKVNIKTTSGLHHPPINTKIFIAEKTFVKKILITIDM